MPRLTLPRRAVLRAAALAPATVALAGCGLLPNVLPSPPPVARKPVALNLYYGPFFVQGGGQSPEAGLMAGIVDTYHKLQPSVTVTATEVTFALFNNFQNLMDPASADHIDVLLGQFVGRFGNVDVRDSVLPVDSFLKRDKTVTAAAFYPAAMHLWWSQGKQLGLPRDIQPNDVIYYNRGLLKNAGVRDPADGWSTDDFLTWLQQLSRAEQSAPANSPLRWPYLDLTNLGGLQDFITLFGGRTTTYPNTPLRAAYDSAAAIAGAQFYVDLYTRYRYAASYLNRAGAYSLGPFPDFLSGNVPLLLAPANLIATLQGVKRPLDWDLTLLPVKTGVKQSWYGNGVAGFITKAATDTDAAWDLLTYLVAGDGMKLRAAVGDVHPAFQKIATSPTYETTKAPLGKRLFNTVAMTQMIDVDPTTLPAATGTPFPGTTPDTQAMLQEINFEMNDVLTGKVDVATMMRKATQEANAALGR